MEMGKCKLIAMVASFSLLLQLFGLAQCDPSSTETSIVDPARCKDYGHSCYGGHRKRSVGMPTSDGFLEKLRRLAHSADSLNIDDSP